METDKGYEIARIPGLGRNNVEHKKSFRLLPFSIFLAIPFCIVLLLYSPRSESADTDQLIIITPVIVIMCTFGYLMFEQVITLMGSPIILFSNGIENRSGHIERIKGRPDFFPKTSITNIEFLEASSKDKKGNDLNYTRMIVRTVDGKNHILPGRKTDGMKEFREALERQGVNVILTHADMQRLTSL